MAVDELDGELTAPIESVPGTEPITVAEPALCPECERLRAVIQTARRRLGQYIMWANPNDLRAALMELDANLSATLTSSAVKESLTPEAEGGQ